MQFVKGLCLFGFSFGIVFCAACFACAQEVSFVSNPLWLSAASTTEGQTVQASTVVTKQGTDSVSGTVTFYAGGEALGTSDFMLSSGTGGAVVSLSFVPKKGAHTVSAKITRAAVSRGGAEETVTVAGEAKATEALVVAPDNDRDEIADAKDADDDNDGVSDEDESKAGTNPLVKETSASVGTVAGTSTELVGQATDIAKNTSAMLLSKAEGLRTTAANYFDTKLKEAEAAKKTAQEAAVPEDGTDLDKIFVAEPKPISEQVKDSSGILAGVKVQAYKALSFIFNNVYAFYIILIVFVLWILRKIWRRHSLD
jgi:hypothetical protein